MQSIINWFRASWTDFSDSFYINFIKDDRWKYLSDGFLVTLEIAFFAVLLGILLGFTVAVIRSTHDKTGKLRFLNLVAIVAFGVNSGAYVAEIIRSGIMSIDKGQFEAGRSLGLSYLQTMVYIILPQAFKNVLPALGNEFIVLLKETSVSGYIALQDLTKAGDIIRSQTYTAFMPLIAVAVIYLAVVMLFSFLLGKLERRLKNNE